MKHKIYVVVLTWNNFIDTNECLESLCKIEEPEFSLILVDNASTDGSVEKLKRRFPDIKTLVLNQNLGISAGYNAGLRFAMNNNAEYIVLSNNDIVFKRDTIMQLIKAAEENKKSGIIVPKTFNYWEPHLLAGIGGKWRKFPPSVKMMGVNSPDLPKFQKVLDLEYAISACYLVTRKLIESIGLYDTNFFFYNDDWDFSIRARKAGFNIILQPDAKILHKVSASTQKSKKNSIWWNYLGRSTTRFYKKQRNDFELFIFLFWFILREMIKLNFDRIIPFIKGFYHEFQQYKREE